MAKRPKIALALGGGGARGIAHIGVLKVLERENIPIDLIVGTSIGALVGTAYAIKPDAAALEKRVAEFLGPKSQPNAGLKLLGKAHRLEAAKSDMFHRLVEMATKEMFLNLVLVRKALISEKALQQCVEPFLTDMDLQQTLIPCCVTAIDLVLGRKVVLKQGPIIQNVMASCAVPGFMPPIPRGEMMLVDGGIVEEVPCGPAKEAGAKVLIGVDVGPCLCQTSVIGDGIDALKRAAEIMAFHLSMPGRKLADVLIEPDVKAFDWTDYSNYEKLIHLGEAAAEAKIEEIRQWYEHPFRKRAMRWQKNISAGLQN